MTIYTIYQAKNIINGKVYIGFDSDWPKRKKTHKTKYKKYHTKFYDSIKKYGWVSFDWQPLYQSKDSKHCLNVMEPYFIMQYDSYNSGYNMTLGGDAVMLNRKHSVETKNKMKNSHLGLKHSEEVLERQRLAIQNYLNNNGSRINTKCLICDNSFKHPKHIKRICCSGSCAAKWRNKNRKP